MHPVPAHPTPVLAQAAGIGGQKGDVTELLVVIGILIGVLILGYVTIMFIRGRMKASADAPPSVSLMDSIRQMHAEGKMTDAEFSAVKAKMSAGLRASVARPDAAAPSQNGPIPSSTATAAESATPAHRTARPAAATPAPGPSSQSVRAPAKTPRPANPGPAPAPAPVPAPVPGPATAPAPAPSPAQTTITRREQTSSGTRISAGPARGNAEGGDGARLARDEAQVGSADLRDSSQQTHRGMSPPPEAEPRRTTGGTPVDRTGTEN